MKGPRNGAGRATVAALVAAFVAASCLDSRAADAGTNADFSRLVAVAISTGRAGEFPPLFASSIGPETKTPVQVKEVAGDGFRHILTVAFAKSARGKKEARPEWVYLRWRSRTKHAVETKYFRADLHGRLRKAYYLHGVLDDSGRVVSGSQSDPRVQDPEIRQAYQAELDYWLKDWLPRRAAAAAKP